MSRPTALTIGNFDAVHRGHVALVGAARSAAGGSGRVVALTFDPHPLAVLRPRAVPPRLSTFDQRAQWLAEAGADAVVPLRPTAELLKQSPEEFVADLVKRYAPGAIVEGADFRFGHGRAGSVETLNVLGKRHGFETIVVEPVEVALSDHSVVRVSSSLIRWLIGHGRVRDAVILLGRAYELRGVITAGDKRGRTIGVPTANLAPTEQLLPADGIYAGTAARPDGRNFAAAISVGTKPTFGEHPRVCEAHLIGYDGPLDDYGWEIRLQFHHWLRDQLAYATVDALIEQLHRDIKAAADAGPAVAGVGVTPAAQTVTA